MRQQAFHRATSHGLPHFALQQKTTTWLTVRKRAPSFERLYCGGLIPHFPLGTLRGSEPYHYASGGTFYETNFINWVGGWCLGVNSDVFGVRDAGRTREHIDRQR